MRRKVLVASCLTVSAALALWLVTGGRAISPPCPHVSELHKAMPGAAIIEAGFIEPADDTWERKTPDAVEPGVPGRVYRVLITTPASSYITEAAAALYAGAMIRSVAAVFMDAGYDPGPCGIRIVLLPPPDILLTDNIPLERKFERRYADAAVELRLQTLTEKPVRLLSSSRDRSRRLDSLSTPSGDVPVRIRIDGLSPRQAAAAMGLAGDDPVWAGGGGEIEVNGSVVKRLQARLLAAIAAAGMDVEEMDAVVFDTDAGDVVMAGPSPLEPPDILPMPLSLRKAAPAKDTTLRAKLVTAYEEEFGGPPAGVLLASIDGMTYEAAGMTKKRVLETESIVAWGEHRFPLDEKIKLYDGWRYVIIHHTATESGSLERIDDYHRNVRAWEYGAGYHFIIGNGHGMGDGETIATHRWEKQLAGAHVSGSSKWNRMSAGVALVGNFEEGKPTEKQMDALVKLLRFLMTQNEIVPKRVMGHRHCPISHTLCPGKNFPWEDLKKRLSAIE